MTHIDPTPGLDPDAIPKVWRTRIYVAMLVLFALAFVLLRVLPIWDVLDPERAAATLAEITTVLGLLTAGLGVGYAPTRVR